jgi:hypothetical protein
MLLPSVLELLKRQVENPKSPIEWTAVGFSKNQAQQLATREVACRICSAPVPLDQCKIDEDGLAVHARCYVEKVSAHNGGKV